MDFFFIRDLGAPWTRTGFDLSNLDCGGRKNVELWGRTPGLTTSPDEIPADFFESLEIPGDFRFLLFKLASKKKFLF